MKKAKRIVIIILALIVLGGGFAIYWYSYQDTHFLSTENAMVTADMISVSPLVTGKLSEWNVQEGNFVKADQVLGRQDIATLVTSSAISSPALGTTADAIASKAEIKSPIDGMVVQSSVIAGQMVAPGSSVVTIADMGNIYISANIEETNIFKVKEGQVVDITIDAYPGKTFTGHVFRISRVTNSVFNPFSSITTSGTFSKTTQLIPVKISIAEADGLTLYPGFNATVKIHIQ